MQSLLTILTENNKTKYIKYAEYYGHTWAGTAGASNVCGSPNKILRHLSIIKKLYTLLHPHSHQTLLENSL